VSVFVNGAEIGNEVLAETIGGLQQQAVRLALVKKISSDTTLLTGPNVSSAAATATAAARATATQPEQFAAYERTAISLRVLRALLFVYAQNHGLVESNGAAAVKARENLQQWEASGSPPMKPLPNGVSGAAGFTSPGAVHARAVADSIDAAETAIAGPSMDSAHQPRNRAPQLAKWFTGALQGAAVSIVSDTPGVSSSADGSVAPSAVLGWLPASL
ncbi:MAG: hypothetical protein ACRDWW_07720, partial [Acidimicrobiales bacterium]